MRDMGDYTPMKPDFKAKWLEALRSGEYTQGRGVLKKEIAPGKFAHCCLGVLADIMVADGVCESRKNGSDNDYGYRGLGNNYWVDTMPTPEMEELAGLDGMASGDLAEMNDSATEPRSFAEIADYIEEYL